jgi:hypothetical protein
LRVNHFVNYWAPSHESQAGDQPSFLISACAAAGLRTLAPEMK